ncbi:MAG: NAD(P)/FAD-dependent oxidoreductase [Pseudomonadota bacterium]
MTTETIDTLVIGAGQAGIAMSEHLGKSGIAHLVLERDRIAESWRTRRWDSLVANGPAWHDRFPNMEFACCGPDGFPGKDGVVEYLESYADQIEAPIRCGVTVHSVQRRDAAPGFIVETSEGQIEAANVIAATGPFQRPLIPPVIPADAPVTQMHSADYRNPGQLAPGGVLVVGAGSSGAQIAEELLATGRDTLLSVGPHDRPPRSYRGRDFCWWLGVLGKWDLATVDPRTAHVTIAVSGANGGRTVDFRRFANDGMTLLGMTQSYAKGTLSFADDLVENIANGDASHDAMLDAADAYVARNGLSLPQEPDARRRLPDAPCISSPIRELDLAAAGISTVIWATGYALDFDWLQVDAFDEAGKPDHRRGVSVEPGVYFLGLPWLSRRGSAFIWGVWHDAKFIADHIVTQRAYRDYRSPSEMNAATI